MTDKQARFIEEYMIDLNATQAAIRAGYSANTARQMGSENLSKPAIFPIIAERKKQQLEDAGVTAQRVLQELAKLGFANMADFMRSDRDGNPVLDFSSLTRDQKAALAEITVDSYTEGKNGPEVKKVKFRLHDKRAALVDLGKHLALFTEKVEHSGTVPITIIYEDA